MAQEFVSVTAIDQGGSSDTMSRNFSTTFQGTENEHMLKSMVTEWEKEIPYRRYHLVTSDDIEEFSEEIQEVLEELEVTN
jgi:hypothetical protein